MEELGFISPNENDKELLLKLNPLLTPVGMRYQGMGWYDVIVKNSDRHLMVEMGGENGWAQAANSKKYQMITLDQLISYEEMMESISKEWKVITSKQEFEGGEVQQVVTMNQEDEGHCSQPVLESDNSLPGLAKE